MILVTQSYDTGDEFRNSEISSCLEANKSSGIFKEIIVVDGSSKRWTLGELFDLCHDRFPGEVCVVANSDIAFSDSCQQAEELLRQVSLLALTRWEDASTPNMLGHVFEGRFFSGTQDSWIFRGASLPRIEIEIPMGTVGCDQVAVGWAIENQVRVADPALSLKTFHVHADESRGVRRSTEGYYGYPELTTDTISPRVLCHQWEQKIFMHICTFK